MSILRQKKIILTAIIPLFLIIGLSIQSYAATTINSDNVYTGLGGVTYNVAGSLTVGNFAYFPTREAKTATSSPVTWTDTGSANTALTANNWQCEFTVTAGSAINSATHVVTVQIETSTGRTTLPTITLTGAIADTDVMTLAFNLGSSVDDISAVLITIT